MIATTTELKYQSRTYQGSQARLAIYDKGRREVHAVVGTTLREASFERQLASVLNAARELEREFGDGRDSVFRRYYLSDATNQAGLLPADDCSVSVIQQAPLDGTKIALLLIFEEDGHGEVVSAGDGPEIRRDKRGIVWMGDRCASVDSARECGLLTPHLLTVDALQNFDMALERMGGSLRENCLRTWFFVRDVDVNYHGVVTGRNEMFTHSGLTAATHFISSTGIEGRSPHTQLPVVFNAVADLRVNESNMTFLKGETHLNSTIEYGVAFERGTAVDYADRRHVYISGTASIDNHGQIVAPGDIEAQTDRMLENIGVLLAEAGCTFEDVAHMVVYLRDISDRGVVEQKFAKRFGSIPHVIVQAPVCRPGWLIETECMAICDADNPGLPAY